MQNSNSKAGTKLQQSTTAEVQTSSSHNAKPNVSRRFSSEDLHGIWQFADAQRQIIVQKHEQSSNSVEMMCLAFAANCIVDIMDEIAELLEPSGNGA